TEVSLLGALSRDAVLALVAALERGSAHPLAQAFRPFDDVTGQVTQLRGFDGAGIEAHVDGVRWRVGRRRFVEDLGGGTQVSRLVPRHAAGTQLYLGNAGGGVAGIEVGIP